MEKLQTAIDKLQTFRASDFRELETPEPQEKSSPWTLSDEAISRLSPETRAEIEAYSISLSDTPLPEITQILEQELIKAGKQVYLPTPPTKVVKIGSNFYPISASQFESADTLESEESSPVDNPSFHELIGVVDLQVVKQEIQRYEAGEVAHIENILKGESNERIHRQLKRTEETYLTETETTTTTEEDLQSTERFELQREAQETIKEDNDFDATVTAKYGSLNYSIEAGTKVAMKSSSEKSARSATNYARDVTQRTVSRIQERSRELRTRVAIQEAEETTTHGIDNKGQDKHIVGIYKWVNKIYMAQVFSYGLRTMYEFIIPEPAAFTIYAQQNNPQHLNSPEPPKGPLTLQEIVIGQAYGILPLLQASKPALTPERITPENYQQWIGQYGVQGIEPPPPFNKTVEHEWKPDLKNEGNEGKPQYLAETTKIKIPDGYEAVSASIQVIGQVFAEWTLGGNIQDYSPKVLSPTVETPNPLENGIWKMQSFLDFFTHKNSYSLARPINIYDFNKIKELHVTGEIPFSIRGWAYDGANVTISIICERKGELAKWQQKTYDSIMVAYTKLKSEYEDKLAAESIQEGIVISGRNPELNRELERNELKKGALSLLTQRYQAHFNDGVGAIKEANPPEIEFKRADEQARIIQFLEQGFEWNQMTYTLYPYFWARKGRWVGLQQMDDTDPIHAKFLRAGAARVWVPVRPYYEGAIRHYWNTGKPWKGINPNSVTDPAFVSVITSIKEELGNYYSEGEGTISVVNGKADVIGKKTKFTEENHLNYEIIIRGKQYRIGEVISDTYILLRENYTGESEENIPYSIGAKFIGEPWEVRIPTSLVIIQQEDEQLPYY
ncbi:MAG TPA: hypothetical protein VN278_04415 [Methanosarcina sp.]|nr:hypothetical protein [Methanosarcina sp.]